MFFETCLFSISKQLAFNMAIKFCFPIFILMIFSAVAMYGQQPQANPVQERVLVLVEPEDKVSAMLDSLFALKIFNAKHLIPETSRQNINMPFGQVPVFPESVYRERLMKMDDLSPIEFVYNQQVRSFIAFYAERRRGHTERMLGLSRLYFPFFEEQLDKYGLPLELKYLAVVESALNPTARSRAGATGIWQFMYNTGKAYGLEVGNYVDYRRDVIKATDAACRHLLDLHSMYGDWWLVLAAYNAGAGNVNRAIRRSGGKKSFWEINRFLPRETQNYIPTFIAVAYVMKHAGEHNLFPIQPVFSHASVDTLHVKGQLSLSFLSEHLQVSIDHLRFLNPIYSKNIIPHNPESPYVLNLPVEFVPKFIANEDTFYSFSSVAQEAIQESLDFQATTITHVVKRGETLGVIAKRYGTTVREIQSLSNIRSTKLRVGQRLTVSGQAPPEGSRAQAAVAETHVVRRGENLGSIARRYRVTVAKLKTWNNLTSDKITTGQRLKVKP